MTERVRYQDPYIETYQHYGTILRNHWHDYILWDDSQKWEYLEDWLRAADANNWKYEIIEFDDVRFVD